MMNHSIGNAMFSVLLLLNRLALGSYFLLAGVGKFSMGLSSFVNGPFQSARPSWLPPTIATPYGYTLPFVEILAGGLLAVGLMGRLSASLITLMLLSFVLAMGVKFEPLPFHPNLILLPLAGLLAMTGPGVYSLDVIVRRKKAKAVLKG